MDKEETTNKTTSRKNVWHLVFIIAALIPLNYAIFVTLKSSFKSGDTQIAGTADGIDNLINATKDNPCFNNFLNLGLAYYNAHRYNEAIIAWQSAVQYNPNSEVVYSNIGSAYGCMGKWIEQKTYCEKALVINPNFALAKNNLKWALDELAKSDTSAVKKTGALPAPNPAAEFNALINEGLSFYNQKEYAKAIASWQKALLINPNSDLIYNNMGAAYGCLGKWREQVQCCEKALAINPNLELAKNNLKWGKSELIKQGQKP